MNDRTTLLTGAILGFLGVALGAFGAHALKPMLAESGRLDTYELAVRYQFYHALALLLTGILQRSLPCSYFKWASAMFVVGVLLFSGSLYLLCFTRSTGIAMITPLGGVALIAGWIFLGLGSWVTYKNKTPS